MAEDEFQRVNAFLMWTTKAGESKSLFFDVVTTETQDLVSEVTEFPVEEGPDVADHVRRSLDRVSLEVFVSNTPIYDVNSRGGKTAPLSLANGAKGSATGTLHYKADLAPTPGSLFNAIGGAVRGLLGGDGGDPDANVFQFAEPFDAVAETLTTLEELRRNVQLLDVVTSVRSYESMFLEHITCERNAESGTGGTFKLEFRELRKVQVSIVTAPAATEERGKVAVKKGQQAPEPTKPGPKKSIAKALYDSARGKK